MIPNPGRRVEGTDRDDRPAAGATFLEAVGVQCDASRSTDGSRTGSCNSSGRSWVAGAIMLGGHWRSIHDPLQSDSLGEVDEESARDQ